MAPEPIEQSPSINLAMIPTPFIAQSQSGGLPLFVALKALKHAATTSTAMSELDMLADVLVLYQLGDLPAAQSVLAQHFNILK